MSYRRSYNRSSSPSVDSTRREIVGSIVLGAGAISDETITLPNVPDQSMGLRIHEIQVEIADGTKFDAASDVFWAVLSTQTVAAAKYLSDPDVIAKVSYAITTTAAVAEIDLIKSTKLYPPRIVMGTQFHLAAFSTEAVTIHYKITYSLIKLSMQDALAALTTMQF